jgi:hypothetical protein
VMLTFNRGGSAAKFVRGDWQGAEDWATWGGDQEFGLDLPLQADKLPDKILLQAEVAPNLGPNFPDLSMQVLVNGVSVGRWSFQYSPDGITTRSVEIPRSVLTIANPAQIRFRALGAVHSPTEMGKGQDPRNLSLAFLKLTLEPAP